MKHSACEWPPHLVTTLCYNWDPALHWRGVILGMPDGASGVGRPPPPLQVPMNLCGLNGLQIETTWPASKLRFNLHCPSPAGAHGPVRALLEQRVPLHSRGTRRVLSGHSMETGARKPHRRQRPLSHPCYWEPAGASSGCCSGGVVNHAACAV